MSWELSPIRFLDFYLLFFFIINTLRRVGQYHAAARMVVAVPKKWPLLFELIKSHRTVFMTTATIAPGLLALALAVVQLIASRFVWPEAGQPPDGLTLRRLWEHWPCLFAVIPLGLIMFGFDVYAFIFVGELDRTEMEKHFDQAEYWLRSRTASVVRLFTFGFINPRRMVKEEVQKSLVAVSKMLNYTLWWVIAQMGFRLAFGLSLWLTWAYTK